jgi:iron(III) transport system ATP-binding protein
MEVNVMEYILQLKKIEKIFGDKKVVNNFNLNVNNTEFITLLGPSGCGKTTTLRMIAGFIKPTRGSIFLSDDVLSDEKNFLPPERRGMGMVFQSYAVWPHMNVFDNIAYPIKLKGESKQTINDKVDEVLKMVKLDGYEKRFPNELSGGQQQRIALARALIMDPQILLLDEPLSNLDAKLRESMRFEIKELQKKIQVTIIYVTHDQSEAIVMSDRIVVMNKGKIEQIGTPREIYEKPINKFVADFIGLANFVKCKIISFIENKAKIQLTEDYKIEVEANPELQNAEKGILLLRPEKIEIKNKNVTGIPAEVVQQTYLGNSIDYIVNIGDQELRINADSLLSEYEEGDKVSLVIKDGAYLIKDVL